MDNAADYAKLVVWGGVGHDKGSAVGDDLASCCGGSEFGELRGTVTAEIYLADTGDCVTHSSY